MIPVRPKDAEVDLTLVEKQATNCFRTNIYTLLRARREVQNAFPFEERGLGRFVAGFVKAISVLMAIFRPVRHRGSLSFSVIEDLWVADAVCI